MAGWSTVVALWQSVPVKAWQSAFDEHPGKQVFPLAVFKRQKIFCPTKLTPPRPTPAQSADVAQFEGVHHPGVLAGDAQLVAEQSMSLRQGSPIPMKGHVTQLLVRQCWRLIHRDAPPGYCCSQLQGWSPQLSSHCEKLTHAWLACHAFHAVSHGAIFSHATQVESGAIDMAPDPALPDVLPEPLPDELPDEPPDEPTV
jgi:hypothetical protein